MKRHRWFKWKTHHRMCNQCGLVKVNVKTGRNSYVQEYHTPDGDVMELAHTPPCAPGPKTGERLHSLTEWIARHPSAAAVQGQGAPA